MITKLVVLKDGKVNVMCKNGFQPFKNIVTFPTWKATMDALTVVGIYDAGLIRVESEK